jgi:hypothetical protein
MKSPSYEGVFVALIPQRGSALLELLREAGREMLGARELKSWNVELGQLGSPAGAVAFRLSHPTEPFPWRDGGPAQLAEIVSRMGPGRCWAVALEQAPRTGENEGWAETVAFDRGERVGGEESTGVDAASDQLAWLGEQLALSENEVLALFESCDQTAGLLEGEERFDDEIDQILARARQEYERYRQLRGGDDDGEGES